jgi:hypothetical protein
MVRKNPRIFSEFGSVMADTVTRRPLILEAGPGSLPGQSV